MKKLIHIAVFLISAITFFAQNNTSIPEDRPLNIISINLFGEASNLSIDIERRFRLSQQFYLSGKLGMGYNKAFQLCLWGPCSKSDMFMTLPHHLTAIYATGPAFVEFGLGGTFFRGQKSPPYLIYPILGFGTYPLKANKLNFRFFINIPIPKSATDDIFFSPVGISLGISH